MYALCIKPFVISHFEQLVQDITADLRSAGMTCNTEDVTAAGDFNVEAAFDLPQVFIKLTAKVGKAIVIGGLEDNVPRNLDGAQNLYLEPLRRKRSVRTTAGLPGMAMYLSRLWIIEYETTLRLPGSQVDRAGNSAALPL